jgi:hypothetical protein
MSLSVYLSTDRHIEIDMRDYVEEVLRFRFPTKYQALSRRQQKIDRRATEMVANAEGGSRPGSRNIVILGADGKEEKGMSGLFGGAGGSGPGGGRSASVSGAFGSAGADESRTGTGSSAGMNESSGHGGRKAPASLEGLHNSDFNNGKHRSSSDFGAVHHRHHYNKKGSRKRRVSKEGSHNREGNPRSQKNAGKEKNNSLSRIYVDMVSHPEPHNLNVTNRKPVPHGLKTSLEGALEYETIDSSEEESDHKDTQGGLPSGVAVTGAGPDPSNPNIVVGDKSCNLNFEF